jgi:hypothetical protein
MIIVMEQCFSGGFIHELSGLNRVLLTDASEEESSWAEDTLFDANGDPCFDEFVYHLMRVVNGEDMTADANSDHRISMVEAFNYASTKDNRPETPRYDDNGEGVGNTVTIPKGGDGVLGANIDL